jgi:ribulose-phosphate 3-epimerase
VAVIAPTILVEDVESYKAKVVQLHEFAERVQVDITDGEFATANTIDESQVWWPTEWQTDLHMMVKEPSKHIDTLIKLSPNLVIFHAEVEEDLLPTIKKLKNAGIGAGVALLKPTFPASVSKYIKAADHVMIFSGDLGHQGGKASLLQLEKVHLIKNINPDTEIGWDGGANLDNVFNMASAGVDVINVGGAIERASDPAAMYRSLVETANKHGVVY